MSVKIVQKPLPAGVVPYAEIADPVMKQKVMLLNRNIASLASQLAECQRAAIELQATVARRNSITDPETIIAIAAADATQKANHAIETAAADATQKKNAAIETAAADATQKVNTHSENTVLHVNNDERMCWNGKYSVPQDGIPRSDLSQDVRTSLQRADIAITSLPSHKDTHKTGGADALSAADIGAAPSGYVAVKEFSVTTPGVVYSDSTSVLTIDISHSGHTPVAIFAVRCFGTSTGYYNAVRAAFTCSEAMISGSNASLSINMVSNVGVAAMPVEVKFLVLYLKN